MDVIYNNNSQLLRNVTGLAEHKHNQAKNEVEHQNESIFTNKKKVVVKKDLGIEGDQPLLAKGTSLTIIFYILECTNA